MLNTPSIAEAQTIQPAPQPMVMQGRDMRVQEYPSPSMPAYTAQAAVNLQPAPQMYAQPQMQPAPQPRMQPQVQAAQPAPQPVYARLRRRSGRRRSRAWKRGRSSRWRNCRLSLSNPRRSRRCRSVQRHRRRSRHRR